MNDKSAYGHVQYHWPYEKAKETHDEIPLHQYENIPKLKDLTITHAGMCGRIEIFLSFCWVQKSSLSVVGIVFK